MSQTLDDAAPEAPADEPTFRLVMDQPTRPGPLAPYRFALSLGFAAVVAGQPLADAVQASGDGLDTALLRAFGAAALMWFPTGLINRLLANAEHPE